MIEEYTESIIKQAISKTTKAINELNEKIKTGRPITQDEVVAIDDLLVNVKVLKLQVMKRMRYDGATYSEIGKAFKMSTINTFLLLK